MIKIGEPKDCTADLEIALLRDHAGGLLRRSTELTHDLCLEEAISACVGDFTISIREGPRLGCWSIHKSESFRVGCFVGSARQQCLSPWVDAFAPPKLTPR